MCPQRTARRTVASRACREMPGGNGGDGLMTTSTDVTLDPEREYEMVAGRPKEKELGGARHGGVGARLIVRMGGHVETHGLGGIYGADTSFRIGNNERLPDVAFVSAERIPPEGEPDG